MFSKFYKEDLILNKQDISLSQGCYLCNSCDLKFMGKSPDFPESKIIKCIHCGLIFTSPTPTDKELFIKYREEYRKIRKEHASQEYMIQSTRRAHAQKEFIRQTGRDFKNANILDIGCAAGALLKQFANDGNKIFGFEPDKAMFSKSQENLGTFSHIWNSAFNVDLVKAYKFDLIMASHVLEHVPDPIQFLKDLIPLLSDKGIIFIEVPNESPESVYEQTRQCVKGLMHLWFFQLKSLVQMIDVAGGVLVRSATYGPKIKYFSHLPISQRGLRRRLLWKIGSLLRKISSRTFDCEWSSYPQNLADCFGKTSAEEGIWIRIVFDKGN